MTAGAWRTRPEPFEHEHGRAVKQTRRGTADREVRIRVELGGDVDEPFVWQTPDGRVQRGVAVA